MEITPELKKRARLELAFFRYRIEERYIQGKFEEQYIRALADEDEECAEAARKIDAGLIKPVPKEILAMMEEECAEEAIVDEEEERISWNEILYWDAQR